jgi:hypothetical protein
MEYFVKIIGTLASLFAAYKITVDVILAKSSKHREEYEFTKNYLLDLNNNEIHPYILEKGFLALSGKYYPVPEIQYLLSMPSPSKAISLRASSGKCLAFDEKRREYQWVGIYRFSIFRKTANIIYVSLYIAFALLAMIPIIFSGIEFKATLPIATYSISFGVVAIASLIYGEDFKAAMNLVKVAERHTNDSADPPTHQV